MTCVYQELFTLISQPPSTTPQLFHYSLSLTPPGRSAPGLTLPARAHILGATRLHLRKQNPDKIPPSDGRTVAPLTYDPTRKGDPKNGRNLAHWRHLWPTQGYDDPSEGKGEMVRPLDCSARPGNVNRAKGRPTHPSVKGTEG